MDMHSLFELSATDGRPMYLQIMQQIRDRIALGDWPAGSALPSIRQLAADLRVSVITIKRAYQELEREGIIQTQQGRGSQVSGQPGLAGELRRRELETYLGKAAELGVLLRLSSAELEALLRTSIDRIQGESS